MAASRRTGPDTGLDAAYVAALQTAKAAIQAARTRAVLAVNGELLALYWDLGRLIADRQGAEGWGAKVLERFSNDLRAEFPTMTGLSRSNLLYMRAFALAWPERAKVPQLVGLLPWGHNRMLLDKLTDPAEREWYARAAIEHGWSRVVLEHQIMSQLHRRSGAAPSNFERLLPAPDSELMQQATRDPYHLTSGLVQPVGHHYQLAHHPVHVDDPTPTGGQRVVEVAHRVPGRARRPSDVTHRRSPDGRVR